MGDYSLADSLLLFNVMLSDLFLIDLEFGLLNFRKPASETI